MIHFLWKKINLDFFKQLNTQINTFTNIKTSYFVSTNFMFEFNLIQHFHCSRCKWFDGHIRYYLIHIIIQFSKYSQRSLWQTFYMWKCSLSQNQSMIIQLCLWNSINRKNGSEHDKSWLLLKLYWPLVYNYNEHTSCSKHHAVNNPTRWVIWMKKIII